MQRTRSTSSAAGALGVMPSYDRIPARFKADMPAIENKKFSYTDYSLDDIVKSTETRALKIIKSAGGLSDTEVFATAKKRNW